jgi:superfamily I DNA/RNA helicase
MKVSFTPRSMMLIGDGSTIVLDENYRSKQKILDLSNALIKNNRQRVSKDLKTSNGAGEDVTYYHVDSSLSEEEERTH